MSYYGTIYDDEYLAHHGVKGMKWGVRKAKDAYKTRLKNSTFYKGDEKYIKLTKRKAMAANKEAYKATLKRKAKRLAIGAGVATAAAGAVGAGLGIANSIRNKKNGYKVQNDQILTNRTMAGISPAAAENYINYRKAKDINNRINAGKMNMGVSGISRSNMLNTGNINGIPKPKKKLF